MIELTVFEALDEAIRTAAPEERPALALALAARLGALAAGMTVPRRGPDAPEANRLLTMPEVAERLAVTEHQAREMGRRSELPVITVGERFVRVRARSLEDWIRRREGATLSRARGR